LRSGASHVRGKRLTVGDAVSWPQRGTGADTDIIEPTPGTGRAGAWPSGLVAMRLHADCLSTTGEN